MSNLFKLTIVIFLISFSLPLKAERKDPTQPPAYENTQPNITNKDIKITAIYSGGDNPKAIIGKHIFNIGDKISDGTIVAIGANGITLKNDDGSLYIIEMTRTIVKTPTTKTPTTKNRKENRENLD